MNNKILEWLQITLGIFIFFTRVDLEEVPHFDGKFSEISIVPSAKKYKISKSWIYPK